MSPLKMRRTQLKRETDMKEWLLSLLQRLDSTDDDFTGLGLLVYKNREKLPVVPLTTADCGHHLPAVELQNACVLLSDISRKNSPFHDGFHLVSESTFSVTDICQFLSPPIPNAPLIPLEGGARHMAARLASLLPDVTYTVVCNRDGVVTLYEAGERMKLDI